MRTRLFATALAVGLIGWNAPATFAATGERLVTVPAGTLLHLRLENSVGADISRVEEPVRADVTRPVVVRGVTVIPAGSTALGHVVAVRRAGHFKERSLVTVRFTEVKPRGEDEAFRIDTRSWTALGPSLTKRTAAGIGVPAAGGALVGALIGGGKGAGIGAAAGAGAGTARLMVTRGKNVRVPKGTVVSVRLTQTARMDVRGTSGR
jgi:hypothetical protein